MNQLRIVVICIFVNVLSACPIYCAEKEIKFRFFDQMEQITKQFEGWSDNAITNENAQTEYLRGLASTLRALAKIAEDSKSASVFMHMPENATELRIGKKLLEFAKDIRMILHEIENPFGDPINVFAKENRERKDNVDKLLRILADKNFYE